MTDFSCKYVFDTPDVFACLVIFDSRMVAVNFALLGAGLCFTPLKSVGLCSDSVKLFGIWILLRFCFHLCWGRARAASSQGLVPPHHSASRALPDVLCVTRSLYSD